MMLAENSKKAQNQQSDAQDWFDTMVQNLKLDKTLHEIDVLVKEKKELYDAMIAKDHDFMHSYARQTSSAFFISNMVESYFNELSKSESKPLKIALELSNSKILVWAEINEDDEIMEDTLILAEAKTNSVFSEYGFHISSTIVESCDALKVPKHYKNVAIA